MVRVVDLQRERTGSTIASTLNVGVAVPAYNWYLFGFDDRQPDASLGVVSSRVGSALEPPRDFWFIVGPNEALRRRDSFGAESPSDGSELLHALNERVIPTLARFSTPQDVLAYSGRPRGGFRSSIRSSREIPRKGCVPCSPGVQRGLPSRTSA